MAEIFFYEKNVQKNTNRSAEKLVPYHKVGQRSLSFSKSKYTTSYLD